MKCYNFEKLRHYESNINTSFGIELFRNYFGNQNFIYLQKKRIISEFYFKKEIRI